ncbi:hypothetical protein QPK87_02150 [Kamptonema cortianum]|nr:hypothetical protein [Oscillatoria laete-virens]MDK3155388.1 hypothetical protein [Kamptonema cortianum]MDL5046137.1 hypothetical protein [Oscillatoria amoena NRMC-F 0135]MDL5052836.1 hypothetical protein [Oscillatoria laete-virens NRMC-F 0139]
MRQPLEVFRSREGERFGPFLGAAKDAKHFQRLTACVIIEHGVVKNDAGWGEARFCPVQVCGGGNRLYDVVGTVNGGDD